ncbi:MAG: CHASE2 domain-containing protein [Gammaproteobacteria bacterium]|nr:CHASE2 domain-containing protein [Gammaproteobacteria bacterium]
MGLDSDNGDKSGGFRSFIYRVTQRPCGKGRASFRSFLLYRVAGDWELRCNFWIRFFLSSIFLALLYQLDPFGLSSLSQHHSQTLFQRWTADLYPDREVARKISVVLFSDAELEKMHLSWPPPYSVHAEVLERILEFSPKAVFVDIAFVDQHRNDPTFIELGETIRSYREKKIPLFFAAGRTDGNLPDGVIPDLAAAGALLVGVPGTGDDRQSFSYPLEVEINAGTQKHRECSTRLSAATAMYASSSLNDSAASNSQMQRSFLTSKGYLDDQRSSDMQLVWRFFDKEGNNGPFRCKPISRSPLLNFWQGLNLDLTFSDDVPPKNRSVEVPGTIQVCPPQDTISVEQLLFNLTQEFVRELKCSLQQSFVIYGAYIAFNEDLVDPPTHTPIPGAFYHAMALDNLLTFGSEYRRTAEPVFDCIGLTKPMAIELVSLLLLVLLVQYGEFIWRGLGPSDPTAEHGNSRLLNVSYLLALTLRNLFLILLLLVGGAVFSTYLLLQPSTDFLGLLGLLSIKSLPFFGRMLVRIQHYFHLN